ncbi:MAG: acyltransferase family protein [Paracoccaceae bacterium]
MKYRPEIDGLRALAVVPVIIHHTHGERLTGGAAGVDVFFVISGFLITQILFQDLMSDQWSITRFYERRARRIFPALFAMLAVSLVMAWLLFLPFQMIAHAKAVSSAMLFVSNFYFLVTVDYFSAGIKTNALIHTWSLGVEEQYYLVFPVFLLCIWRIFGRNAGRRAVLWGIGILGILSFAIALWGAAHKPEANFFFSPSRIWELLAGAAAGILYMRGVKVSPRLGQIAAGLGLVVLLASYVLITPAMAFPSGWTLLPAAAAVVLVLFTTDRGPVGRLLTARPVVWIGVISYSLYLWHQPMLAFWRITNPLAPIGQLWLVALCSVPVAWMSWRYVEQPFRTKQFARRQLAAILGGSAAIILSLSVIVVIANPATPSFRRLDAGMQQIVGFVGARIDQTDLYGKGTCFVDGAFPDPAACRPDGETEVILWGDSHAAGLAVGLRQRLTGFGSYGIMRCGLFVADPAALNARCGAAYQQVLEQVQLTQPARVLILRNWSDNQTEVETLGQTIQTIRHLSPETRVIVLGSLPKWPAGLPELLLEQAMPISDGLRIDTDLQVLRQVDRELQDSAAEAGAAFVSLIDLLCEGSLCGAVVSMPDGRLEPISFDAAHLGEAGALHLTDRLVPMLGLTQP